MSGNQPTLIVTGGPLDGQILRLARRGQTVLGSGPDTVTPLALANVAAHHATLEWDGQELHLAALETPTGTYVNGERISATHVLADGDRLCLGPPGSKQSVKLVVRLSADEGEPEEEAAGAAEEALPGFEAPDLDGTLDLSSPSAPEAPSLLLIDPDAAEPREPAVAETALPGWSDTPVEPPAPALVLTEPEPAAEPPQPPPEAAPAPPPRTEARHRPEYTHEIPSMLPEEAAGESAPARPAPPAPGPPPTARPRALRWPTAHSSATPTPMPWPARPCGSRSPRCCWATTRCSA